MGATMRKALRPGGAALLVAVLFGLPTSASAAPPDFVLRTPPSDAPAGLSGSSARTNNPRGVVGNPDTGHVYVADLINARINEYTAWGLFVKSWGWDVAPEGMSGDTPTDELETCSPPTPEAEPPPGLCKAGVAGPGKGQLNWPTGLAVDPSGNIYVFEFFNRRVQKFNPAGEFLLMFGGDVNQTKVGEGAPAAQRNLCTDVPGDTCQAGTSGEGTSQLDATLGDFIAYSPAEGGTILVGDKGGIQVFDTNGNHVKTIPFSGALAAFAGKQVNGLDVDKDQNIYISLDATEDIYKLSPAGAPLDPGKPGSSSFDAENPLGVAADVDGSVYAIDDPAEGPPQVTKYNATGQKLVPTASEAGEPFPSRPAGALLTALATNICADGVDPDSEAPGNLYIGIFNGPSVSYVGTYGTAPIGCEPPPPEVPVIGEQFASFVGAEDATVRALINPEFFPDTTYYVEYGTAPCSTSGCPNQAPVPAALLTERSVKAFIPTTGVILENLEPGTTYHYRFVADSSGGEPVHGIDPDGPDVEVAKASFEEGLEATFTTHAEGVPPPPCSNDAFRIGPGADLPDCRAYELVSPLDKGSADVALGIGRNGVSYLLFEANKSADSGERFTFSAATGFGDAQSAPFTSQYLAGRKEGGWNSNAISAPRTEPGVASDFNFGPEFLGFTEDLCRGWLRLYSVAPLVPEAVAKYPNLYRRENCVEPPKFVAMTTDAPPNRTSEQYVSLLIKGFSEDGSHTIFTVPGKLDDAPEPGAGEELLYEHTPAESPEDLRFVCYLPSGESISEACSAGTSVMSGSFDFSSVRNAISADGSRIFWTAYEAGSVTSRPGRIFVRIDGNETVAISEAISPGPDSDPAFFWTAADDGSKAIFSFVSGDRKGELYEFDVDTETATLIADGVEGPMGASEDASRLYFASTEDLDGTGPAAAGAHNLYFYEANPGGGLGSYQFVMALTTQDVSLVASAASAPPMRPVVFDPASRAARITSDGLHATFVSRVSPTPTGYDNRDIESGQAAAEVYRYDAGAGDLRCVSCNPTGARPVAEVSGAVMAAARIQGWEVNNHAPRVITDDGSRIFFESHEALVPRDSNGTWDVYQWEEPGKGGPGGCTEEKATFSEKSGGCVDLLSSGQSAARSLFLDADPSGNNVFIATQSSLVGQDYGLNDVYVARVGGGFPEPVPPGDCEGAACQSPPPPPPLRTPASEAFQGPGNETGKPKARRCPKGKRRVTRKGKARCVKKRSSRANKQRKGQKGGRR
ncbi:MAG TPA: hypothetical protein VEQ41_05475 [Solirubrobacterales bacterium]|nr:hypothetical protein [Solirubrobacterales bacterium]